MILLAVAALMPLAPAFADVQVIALRDGGRVVLDADGRTKHYDATGNAVAMKDGDVMIANDGTRVMMKGESLWEQIVQYGTNAFAAANALPRSPGAASARSVALNDGGWIALQGDGSMIHYDAAGNKVAMKDGERMIARDGTAMLMSNGALWSATRPAKRTP